jgi:hypothetical protein
MLSDSEHKYIYRKDRVNRQNLATPGRRWEDGVMGGWEDEAVSSRTGTKVARNENIFNAEGAEKAETKTLNHRFTQIEDPTFILELRISKVKHERTIQVRRLQAMNDLGSSTSIGILSALIGVICG